jgi:hypothetical protein
MKSLGILCLALFLIRCGFFTPDVKETKGVLTTFIWSDESCDYGSYFDSTRITREQITNAYQISIWNFHSLSGIWVFKTEDIEKIDIQALDFEYNKLKKTLADLALPEGDVWFKLKCERLKELDDQYRYNVLLAKAFLYDDYDGLDLQEGDSCVSLYANAMQIGGDSLRSAWWQLTQAMAAGNGYPENIFAEYEAKEKDSAWQVHAKLDVLIFGWWNCAIAYMYIYDASNARADFEALFESTRVLSCNECHED